MGDIFVERKNTLQYGIKPVIPLSHQTLSCLESCVSNSSAVSLPINPEQSTPLLRQLKLKTSYTTFTPNVKLS